MAALFIGVVRSAERLANPVIIAVASVKPFMFTVTTSPISPRLPALVASELSLNYIEFDEVSIPLVV